MNKISHLIACACVAIFGQQLSTNAATLTVDLQPGVAQYTSIQAALNAAGVGDTVLVNAGTYYERVAFVSGGTASQPVTLEGKPGAIIDGSTPTSLNWTLDPSIAPGVYKATVNGFFPYTIVADGKVITTIDEGKADDPGDAYDWENIFTIGGIGTNGWPAVKALAMFRDTQNELIIRFDGLLNPNSMDIKLGPKNTNVILIDGHNHCVVRGMTVQNAPYGIRVENSTGSVIDNCTIRQGDYGIFLGVGSDSATVSGNEITMTPYADLNPWLEESWDTWIAHKRAGFSDRYCIRITLSDGGHDIHDNYMHHHFDGLQAGQSGTAQQNGNLDIHHNYFYYMLDDAMETSNGQVNNRWHDNIAARCRRGTRIKGPIAGPLYIYRNIYFENKGDIVSYSGSSGLAPTEVWVYHNTTTADHSIKMDYDVTVTTPNYNFYNNIHWCITAKGSQVPDWSADNNVYIRFFPGQRPWVTEWETLSASSRLSKWNDGIVQMNSAGVDQNSLWLDGPLPGFTNIGSLDVSLVSSSPARAVGCDLSQGMGTTLPGAGPGYFSGVKPDVGALQFGESMPLLPRTGVGAGASGGSTGGGSMQLGAVNKGIAAIDSATGTGFIMWSQESVHTRFNPDPHSDNSDNLLAVKWNGSQWLYDNNSTTTVFTPVSTDVLIASVSFSADTITSLQGTNDVYNGISRGYASGDLTFFADQWDGSANDGEFTVTGTSFTTGSGGSTVSLGAVNKGVAAIDSATGTGFIMWSEANVFTRFSPVPYSGNSDNLIAVKWSGSQWLYDNNSTTTVFTPVASDVLIADVDFSADTITSLQGVSDVYNGISRGFASGDLAFYADRWENSANDGEFTVTGTSFVKNGAGSPALVFDIGGLSDYSSQTASGSNVTVESGGTTVRLAGNIWQKFALNYTVTANTMLEVTVDASDTGEIMGIGLDSDNNHQSGTTNFKLSGSQSASTIQAITPAYTAGEGAVTYVIAVGTYFTGNMNYITFIGDDDAGAGTVNAAFSGIRVYEQ